MKNSFLNEEIALLQSNAWVTRITDVKVTDRDAAQISIRRPDCGTGVGYGGILRVFDLGGKMLVEQKVAQTTPPSTTVLHILKDSKLDFYSQEYTIGYGPENADKGEDSMSTRVQVAPDVIIDFQGSACNLMHTTNSRVTARYSVPRSFSNISSMRMYVVEGGVMKDSNSAIQGKIHSMSATSLPTDVVNLMYTEGTFVLGKQYTVCLNVYSWTREIAGQSFTFS